MTKEQRIIFGLVAVVLFANATIITMLMDLDIERVPLALGSAGFACGVVDLILAAAFGVTALAPPPSRPATRPGG